MCYLTNRPRHLALIAFLLAVLTAAPAYARFGLHLTSHKAKKTAQSEIQRLQQEDRKAFIQEVHLPEKGRWFRVCLGPFETRGEARREKTRLQAAGYQGYAAVLTLPNSQAPPPSLKSETSVATAFVTKPPPPSPKPETQIRSAFVPEPPENQSITLRWEPSREADLDGYKIYYGTSPGPPYDPDPEAHLQEGPPPIMVGAEVTRITLHGLKPGMRYFFAVTAFNRGGTESGFSGEVTAQK